ncbi:transmembrane protein [Thraustotheca clavata]|uniref:Transmembrane protein n=1 Tax=Thraustotheca clavata TaxID=74557 RepID=A0A1V9ZPH4_9STRA|nr:transmembrane protein [Thraustotheca clavata]
MSEFLTNEGFVEQSTPRSRHVQNQHTFSGYDNIDKPKHRPGSLSSIGGETHANLKIDLEKPRVFTDEVISKAEFKMNLELALRTAVGVVISSLFQTKNLDVDLTSEHPKYWALFPDWYILGGISYIAVFFANIKDLCQQIAGVSLALIFSIVLCYSYEPHTFRTTAEVNTSIADGTMMRITKSFTDTAYYIHNYDLVAVLPFMMLYNAIVLNIPFGTNTKRFTTGAIRKLKQETLSAVDTIQELGNLIVDSYCFKDMDAENEQSVGLNYPLGSQKSVTQPFVEHYASLLDDVRAMGQAMAQERCGWLHASFMNNLQRDFSYLLALELELTLMEELEFILLNSPVPTQDVKGNIPLTLFLFSLQSFCTTMMEFPSKLKEKNHKTFPSCTLYKEIASLQAFVDPAKYNKLTFIVAFKVSLAILLACLFSVHIFAFTPTAATTIAYIMGSHIGESFSVTLNRVGGVVAGSIIPSVILFFICSYGCVCQTVVVSISDIVLFFWVTFSIIVELAIWPQSAIQLLRQSVQKHLATMQITFGGLFNQKFTYDGKVDLEAHKQIQSIIDVTSPAILSEERSLLREALFEPLLWRPPFSQQKYEQVIDICHRLLKNSLLLYKLVTWFQYRKANSWTALQPHRCSILLSSLGICCSIESGATHDDKVFSTTEIGCAIHYTFETLYKLFGEHFRYADADQTALFMQIKEAF